MPEPLTREILLRGSAHPPAAWIPVAFGPFTAFFDPRIAGLREIRLGGREALRGIYAAVRDRNWGTVEPKIEDFQLSRGPGSFAISFVANCLRGEIDFTWKGGILGNAAGELVFTFEGVARAEFWRNRIGFCVLHPPDCGGLACEIEASDGRVQAGRFPRLIAPDQPFKDLRAIRWSPRAGAQIEVRFNGDVFETEDQRNWTDASFKTYCTPLERPFPAKVEIGARVSQAVHLRLLNRVGPPSPVRSSGVTLSFDSALERRLPRFGLGCASHGQPWAAREAALLARLRLDHLRVDLRLMDLAWPAALRQAAEEAASIGASLHVAVFVSNRAETQLPALAETARSLPAPVSLWLIYHVSEDATSPEWLEMARRHLAPLDAGAGFAAGSDGFFTQLNRCRPPSSTPALPCYSINPQVHAFDDRTLLENLAAQPATVETAWDFARQPVVLSPVTLRMRANPAATAPESARAHDELPPQVDSRQMSLFCAAWTLGSMARLAAAEHLHSVTYFETTGWLGVLERETGCPLPEQFPSLPGAVFPVYHVFAALAGFHRAIPVWDAEGLSCTALELRQEGGDRRWLAANLRPEAQTVRLLVGAAKVFVRLLDETNAAEILRDPELFATANGSPRATASGVLELTLRPYAFAQIDGAAIPAI